MRTRTEHSTLHFLADKLESAEGEGGGKIAEGEGCGKESTTGMLT